MEYSESEKKFILSLVMEKAGTDLKKILADNKKEKEKTLALAALEKGEGEGVKGEGKVKGNSGLSFMELHCVYKDIITGIAYMHS